MKKVTYSVIAPVFNEKENIANLHREIVQVFRKIKGTYEIIFVDDGSDDGSAEILKTLSPLLTVTLRKNYGQSCALDAGVKSAKGDIIITIDGDGQNDPKDIPEMIRELEKGSDVVCGWRYKRKDVVSKRVVSKGALFFRKFLVDDGVHDSGCTLRVYRKQCFEDMDLYGELHRMIPALLRWRGFKITEMKVNHRPRIYGKTKYNWKRIFNGFLDMLGVWFWRKFESRPLHLFGLGGIILTALSSLLGICLVILRLFFSYALSDKIWPLVAITGFITGVQLFIFGILADLIIKNRDGRSFYKIKNILRK